MEKQTLAVFLSCSLQLSGSHKQLPTTQHRPFGWTLPAQIINVVLLVVVVVVIVIVIVIIIIIITIIMHSILTMGAGYLWNFFIDQFWRPAFWLQNFMSPGKQSEVTLLLEKSADMRFTE